MLEPGKRPGECLHQSSQGHSQYSMKAQTIAHVPTLTHANQAAYTVGKLNNVPVRILLDSGASCSVLCAEQTCKSDIKPITSTKLVNANGWDITPCGTTTMTVTLGGFSMEHPFVVVEHLSTPVILGCDYLTNNGFVLNFKQKTFYRAEYPDQPLKLWPAKSASCHVITIVHKQSQLNAKTMIQSQKTCQRTFTPVCYQS